MTTSGLESIGTWLLSTSVTVAPIRFETQRWRSGCTVWSFVARMYQLGFAFHGVLLSFLFLGMNSLHSVSPSASLRGLLLGTCRALDCERRLGPIWGSET